MVQTGPVAVQQLRADRHRAAVTSPRRRPAVGGRIARAHRDGRECLQCGQTYPIIKQIRNLLSSDLRFVCRHFPTVRTHPHSLRAAEAAEAAGAQGKFWEMHDELFTHQTALEDRDLLRYAGRIGLDLDRFSREMSENGFLPQIQTAYQQSLFDEHVTGTPTIYLNEIRYTGATDLQILLEAIKESAPEGRISLAKRASRIRQAVGKLRRGAGG